MTNKYTPYMPNIRKQSNVVDAVLTYTKTKKLPGLGPITKKLNQLQLFSIFQFNYNYTSKIFLSITITSFQLQLHFYYVEPFVNYVACVADCVYE